jgi:uncharacterized protein
MNKGKELGFSFLAGLVFAIGLGISGMTLPSKVIGFLDVAGDWDPSLAFVMGGAIAVHLTVNRFVQKRGRPLLSDIFHLPKRSEIDGRLVAGAALFGIGWGLGGFCPGPALVSAAAGQKEALLFVGAMTAGMLIQHATVKGPKVLAEATSADDSSAKPTST